MDKGAENVLDSTPVVTSVAAKLLQLTLVRRCRPRYAFSRRLSSGVSYDVGRRLCLVHLASDRRFMNIPHLQREQRRTASDDHNVASIL